MKIAIQGIKGSFHHLVALNYYGPTVDVIECITFQEIFDKLNQKEVERGVMALENSIAGSILPNYALIDDYNMHVIGEYNFSIDQNFQSRYTMHAHQKGMMVKFYSIAFQHSNQYKKTLNLLNSPL